MNKNKNNILTRFFSHNTTLLILSFILAFIIWFIINASSETDTNVTISNIPITIELSDTAQEDGLQIFNAADLTASVEVAGNRVTVGSLSASDIQIVANQTGNIISPGTYSLPLSAKKSGLKTNYNIVSSVNPATVTVFVDRLSEQEFTVENRLSVQLTDSNHYANTSLSQNSVIISGPETQVSQIAAVAVIDSVTGAIDETKTFQESIKYLDSNSNELDLPLVTADVASIEVTINLLPVKNVSLTVDTMNAPDGHPSISIEPKTVKIAGPQNVLDEIKNSTVSIGQLDFENLENVVSKLNYDVTLPSGCRVISGETEAVVSIDLSQYKKTSVIGKITQKIDSGKYAAEFNVGSIAVTVFGPEESVSNISSSDVTITADFTDLLANVTADNAVSLSVPLTVTLSSAYKDCWVYGYYTADANVSMK